MLTALNTKIFSFRPTVWSTDNATQLHTNYYHFSTTTSQAY